MKCKFESAYMKISEQDTHLSFLFLEAAAMYSSYVRNTPPCYTAGQYTGLAVSRRALRNVISYVRSRLTNLDSRGIK